MKEGTVTTPASVEQYFTPAALAQRITKFLAGLERAKRQPNRREAYHLREALELLETERVGEAEQTADLPAHVASLVQTNELGTIEQLRAALGQIQGRR